MHHSRLKAHQMDESFVTVSLEIRAVVLNISRQYEAGLEPIQLYERTRGYWVMQPHDHREVEYAIALAGRIIREVYRIDVWTRLVAVDIPPNPFRRPDPTAKVGRSPFRWMFSGAPAKDGVRNKLVGHRLDIRGQNPVNWLNC